MRARRLRQSILITAQIMTLSGLSLWASPFIAYKVAAGQVFESVSSTISGWMGAIVGAGVELYSASLASSITRQAEETQAQGRYQSEVTRATAGFERDKEINSRTDQKIFSLRYDEPTRAPLPPREPRFRPNSNHSPRLRRFLWLLRRRRR